MVTVTVTSSVYPSRGLLVYKIELSDWHFQDWWESNIVQVAIRNEWGHLNPPKMTYSGANTTVSVVRDGESVEVHLFALTGEQYNQMMGLADTYNDNEGRPGRPQKNVLLLTTSKDRRLGNVKAMY
jgi:hypothetical protein